MSDFRSIRRAVLLVCALAAAGQAGAQSFAPEYFNQFQSNSAMDMVNRLPGFVFEGGNAGRGQPGNVLINGKRPASKTEALGDVLGRIPVVGVERIEVINGGAPGIDMQGYPTIANVMLKPIDLVTASTTVSSTVMPDGSLEPTLDGNYSLKRGDKSINVTVGWRRAPDTGQGTGSRVTQYADSSPATVLTVSGSGINESKSVRVNYGQDLLDGQLTVNGAINPWAYQSQIQFDGANPSVNLNDNAGRTVEQGLAYTRDLSPSTSMDLKLVHRSSEVDSDWGNVTSGGTAHSVTSTSASEQVVAGQLTWQARDGVTIRTGIEHTVNANDASNTWQANAQSPATPGVGAWIQESRTEGQLSSAWQLDRSLNAEAGLRIEHSSLNTSAGQQDGKSYVYPKPRLRLSLSPSQVLQLRLRLEREVSQFSFYDNAGYFGMADKTLRANLPDLVPAKTWLCESAVEYRFWERGAATLSYTQAHISDVIDRMPIRTATATYDTAGNIGDANTDAVTGMLNLPTDSWALPQGLLKLSTTWRSSSVNDPATQTGRRLSGEQPLAWRVEFSQDLPQQRANWGFSLDNGWNNDNWQVAERDTSSGSGWARAYINYRPASNMTLTLELNNLASRTVTNDRVHYAGNDRYASLDFTEHNITRTQPFAMLRLRTDW
jgi:hypothetical protein